MKLSELSPLIDIFDEINSADEHYISFDISDTEHTDLCETILMLLDDYVKTNIKLFHNGTYHEVITEYITNQIDSIFQEELFRYDENVDDYSPTFYDDYINYKEILTKDIADTFYTFVPRRSLTGTCVLHPQDERHKEYIDGKLEYIKKKDELCPAQRTPEWHTQRYSLISASTAWKVVDKENYRNQYIYDKCKPLNTDKFNFVNINSPFHWGTKFEPVSQMYYEYLHGVKIEEYGCIGHRNHECLGASPDGIVVTRESDRYGRMLEIKNIVNREITGIPKKEYWVQTQFQMECCDLEECDFLECRFKLYDSENEFMKDGSFQKSDKGQYKGIIMCFYVNKEPHYEYMPFMCSEEDSVVWQKEMMEKHKENTWVKTDYWYLQEVSCVLIQRNRTWFARVEQEFLDTWKTILHERVHGYSHRKKIREKKQKTVVITKDMGYDNALTNTMNPILFNMVQSEKNTAVADTTIGDTKIIKTTVEQPKPPQKPHQKSSQPHQKPTSTSKSTGKSNNTKHIITIDTSGV